MNPKRVELLADPAVDEINELLARAYLTNPIYIAMFGGSGEKELQMGRDIFKIFTAFALKGEWYAVSDANRIIGVYHMMRFPMCQPSKEQRRKVSEKLQEMMPDAFPRISEWGREWWKRDPNVDHWHLGPIGVMPELQKTGIGRLMMQHFCMRVDETGAMAYLETDRPENVGFYEKSGFTVIEKGIVLDIPNWFMSRPGRETL